MLVYNQMLVNMVPVIQCSVSGVSLVPGPSFTTGKNSQLKKCSYPGKYPRQILSSHKFHLPLPTTSLRLFLPCKTRYVFYRETRTHLSSVFGAEVANEEVDTQTGDGISESPAAVETSEESPEKPKEKVPPVPVKRTRATWKSEMPPVKNEELVPGATFTGKVKAIQSFGAFVDIGAFTDGLVHVSRLSDSFVKDVGRFVSVGQEVKVKLVEANFETGRISLSMRELNDSNKMQQHKVAPETSSKARTARNFTPKAYEKKDDVKKVSKFVVGQELQGTVKNLTRAGAFISLPEEEEGFLPRSEESDEIFVNPMGGSSMRVGQEVNVRVLRSFRGHVTLTMKSDDSFDLNLNQAVVHTATNPFVLAFRKNKALAAYLDERKKVVESTEIKQILKASDETDEMVEKSTSGHAILEVEDQLASGSKSLADEISLQEVGAEANIIDKGSNESMKSDEDSNGVIPKLLESVDGVQIKEEQVVVRIENLAPEGTITGDKIEKNTIGRSIIEVDDPLDGGSESLADEVSLQEVGGETNISDKGLNESVKSDEDSHGVVSNLSESVDGVQITEEQVEVSIGNLASEGTISNSKLEKNTIGHVMVEVDNQLAGGSESSADEISFPEADGDTSFSILDKGSNESVKSDEDSDGAFSKLSENVDGVQIIEEQVEDSIKNLAPGRTFSNDKLDKNTIGHAILEADDQLAGGSGSLEDGISLLVAGGTTKILDKGSNENVKSDDSVGVISKLSESMDRVQLTGEQVEVRIENFDKVENTIGHAIPQADDQLAGGSESLAGEILLHEVEVGAETNSLDIGSNESVKIDEDSDGIISKLEQSKSGVQIIEEQLEVSIESLAPEGTVSNENQMPSNASERPGVEYSVTNILSGSTADGFLTKDKLHIETVGKEVSVATVIGDGQKTISEKNANISSVNEQIVFSTGKESQISGEAVENQVDKSIEKHGVQVQTTFSSFENENVGSVPEENCTSVISEGQTNVLSFKGSFMKAVENQANESRTEDGVQAQTLAENIIPSDMPFGDEKAGPVPDKNRSIVNYEEQTNVPYSREISTKAISPALVKQLRDETGAGMMDCKKALSETGGDIVKAQEFLRKKGLASADKKASRATAEGRIGSYIHDSRIGVLIEVNCETDFVSRGEFFKELVDDLAMQVAASPQVQYLVTDDVPEDLVNKEREVELQKEDLLSKPEQIRSKIVEGRIRKRLEELALLEQPFIKNDKVVVKDWVKQAIAAIGENIKVNRFVRYNLGEGLEKKTQDFATEVAAQTAAKPMDTPALENPITDAAAPEFVQKSAMVIPAALVKRLREETGAGMMDCKKALSETGGDLEKAQAYLRKKGLSSADKKSSRLAAEGRIASYVHDSRIGALIEVNSETDFVGRSEKFRELVNDLAMQVVACPQVQFVSIDEIPESIVKKEKELEMQREDLLSRPENVRGRIVDGRVSKRLGELALLEQAFIKNDSILVKDLVKQTIAALGENIKVRRFIRFTLGEATEGERTTSQASETSAGFDSTIK